MTWRDRCKCVSRAASPWDAVVWAACMAAMLQTRCRAPSRRCAFGCWALEPMSVLARAPTTVVPRAVAVACAVARGVGSRTLSQTSTSAAHAQTPWQRPRPGQEVSGMVKTVRKDGIIFHLCLGLGVWSAAGTRGCRGCRLHTTRLGLHTAIIVHYSALFQRDRFPMNRRRAAVRAGPPCHRGQSHRGGAQTVTPPTLTAP